MLRVILCASMVVWLGAQAQAAGPCAEGELEYADLVDGALYFKWTGEIAASPNTSRMTGLLALIVPAKVAGDWDVTYARARRCAQFRLGTRAAVPGAERQRHDRRPDGDAQVAPAACFPSPSNDEARV